MSHQERDEIITSDRRVTNLESDVRRLMDELRRIANARRVKGATWSKFSYALQAAARAALDSSPAS